MKNSIYKLLLGIVITISAISNIFAQTVDLSTHVTNSSAPSGTSINWYSVSNPDPLNPNTNLVGSYTSASVTPVNVTATTTAKNYWVFFYDSVNKCFSPGSKVTVITNTCPTTTVNLTAITTSTAPANSVLEWHTSSTPTAANKVATPAAVGAGTYYAVYYDSANNCYSPASSPVVVAISPCYCYKTATSGTALPTIHGITSLQRAAANNSDTTDWPIVRKTAHTALEAKTKGFVLNRMLSPETSIQNPVAGMLVFDTDENSGEGCLKLYDGTSWNCLNTQTCPDY